MYFDEKLWRKQINLHWSAFLDSKILEITFSNTPQIYNFFKKLTWKEGSFEVLEESEKSTIIFEYPGYPGAFSIVTENYASDYTMSIYSDETHISFYSLIGIQNAERVIWKTFWDFDMFSYINDFQKITDELRSGKYR